MIWTVVLYYKHSVYYGLASGLQKLLTDATFCRCVEQMHKYYEL